MSMYKRAKYDSLKFDGDDMSTFWSILVGSCILLLSTVYLTFFLNQNHFRETEHRPEIQKKHFSHGTFAIKLEKDRNQDFIRFEHFNQGGNQGFLCPWVLLIAKLFRDQRSRWI